MVDIKLVREQFHPLLHVRFILAFLLSCWPDSMDTMRGIQSCIFVLLEVVFFRVSHVVKRWSDSFDCLRVHTVIFIDLLIQSLLSDLVLGVILVVLKLISSGRPVVQNSALSLFERSSFVNNYGVAARIINLRHGKMKIELMSASFEIILLDISHLIGEALFILLSLQ